MGPPLDAVKIARLNAAAEKMLKTLAPFLDARREAGFVRRVHGDLHLNNICVFEGKPVPFDAIEFQDDFACIDVLFDLALLLMDLDRRGLRREANVLLNRYLERANDYEGLKALPLFLVLPRRHAGACDAGDETKRSAQRGGASSRPRARLSRATAGDASRHRRRFGHGKVDTGRGACTAYRPDARRRRHPDGYRAQNAVGRDELKRLPSEAYDERFTARVYEAMMERAGAALAGGHSAIVDAVFGHAQQRADVERLAHEHNATFKGLWLDAPAAVLEKRIAARRNDASDATADVLRAQLANIRPPDRWSIIDVSGEPGQVAESAARALGLTPR